MSYLRAFLIPRTMATLAGIVLAPTVLATTLHVCPAGCAFSTIQSAVDAAASGDVIQIAAGRYVEKVTIVGKRLTLNGGSSGGVTEVVGTGGHGPVFVLGSGTDGDYQQVDIQYLTISNGNHQTGSGVGGGVQVRRGAFLHLLGSVVTHNSALFGGGIGVNTPGGPATTVTGCLIDDNVSTSSQALGGGGVVAVQGSTVVIQHSTVTRNQAFNGGGIYTDIGTHVTVGETTVSENSVSQVHVHLGFVGGVGGGLYANSDMTISGSTIAHNAATGQELALGGGIFIVLGSTQTITYTVIAHNSATGPAGTGDGGGIFAAAENTHDTLALTKVYVVENEASPGSAGGISNEGTLLLAGTLIKDNSGFNCKGGFDARPEPGSTGTLKTSVARRLYRVVSILF
jgi:hypothetical protein